MLRGLVKKSPPVYRTALAVREARRRRRPWPHAGRLPNAAKHQLIRDTAHAHGVRVLVETGTYEGETCYWLRRDFSRIVTVELEPKLYKAAATRLGPYRHIEVIHGDSGVVLPRILETIDEPALFWLDSHACTTKSAAGGSPALHELTLVLAHPFPHVVLIDDMRLFGGPGWPTVDELRAVAEAFGPTFHVADDIARVLPGDTPV